MLASHVAPLPPLGPAAKERPSQLAQCRVGHREGQGLCTRVAAHLLCPHQELAGGLSRLGEPRPDPISVPTLQQLPQPVRVSTR